MEREEWNGSAPDFHAVQDSETSRHDRILEATEADREARAVQATAREMAETGPAEEPTAESYEAAARRLEHLTESEPDLANNIISARLADIELRDKFGSDRFDLFKQAQTEGLDRIGEDYRIHYRSMLQARNETPDERYQRLRTDLARLMRELYTRSIREIALDDRTKKACARDWDLLTEALGTVKPRLFAELELISVAEEEAFYSSK